jgi:hypothetical protein
MLKPQHRKSLEAQVGSQRLEAEADASGSPSLPGSCRKQRVLGTFSRSSHEVFHWPFNHLLGLFKQALALGLGAVKSLSTQNTRRKRLRTPNLLGLDSGL